MSPPTPPQRTRWGSAHSTKSSTSSSVSLTASYRNCSFNCHLFHQTVSSMKAVSVAAFLFPKKKCLKILDEGTKEWLLPTVSHQSHCSSQKITTPFPTQGALLRFLWVLVRRWLRNTKQSLLQKINQCCKSVRTLWPLLLRNRWHIHKQQYEIRDGCRTPPLADGFTPRANPIISVCGDIKYSSEVRC